MINEKRRIYKKINGNEYLNQLEDKLQYTSMYNSEFAFRKPELPSTENYYSSSENRNRYESIILNKGIELFNQIENLGSHAIRPLGMTLPSNKTLGTGSHAFTWRNISNTCPLVFWWETNGWYPLFPVKNRGKH